MPSKQRVASLAFWSTVIAIAVLGLKVLAWRLTGSVALYSDALESIVNVIASLAAFWAIRVSQTPADRDHPFGHHKAEYFSAVLEGVLIVLAACLIILEVGRAWATPMNLEQPWTGLAVNGAASVVNLVWAQILIRAGRAHRSPALIADGRHIMTDVVTSLGVIVGLVGAVLTGWTILDPALAIVVALNILWQGWQVIGQSVQGLMDRSLADGEIAEIRTIIDAKSSGAIEYHDLKTREAGRARFVEFHLVVPERMAVGDAHDICDRIEDALKSAMPGARVVIHIEPEGEAEAATATTPIA